MLTPQRKHALGEPPPRCGAVHPEYGRKCHHEKGHKGHHECGDREHGNAVTWKKEKRAPSKHYRESQDQKRLVAHMRERGELVIRMEQGEERDPWIAQLHRALGMEPGATDLLWVRPRGRVVFIECKADDGSLRDTQIEHHAVLRRMGHVVLTGYGHAQLVAAYEEHKRSDP